MTIIDLHNKLIIADTLVNEEEFDETTIKNFLKSNLKDKKHEKHNNRWQKHV